MNKLLIACCAMLMTVPCFAESTVTAWNNTSKDLVLKYVECTSDGKSCTNLQNMTIAANSITTFQNISPNASVSIQYADDLNNVVYGSFGAANCRGFFAYSASYTLRIDMRPDNVATCTSSFG